MAEQPAITTVLDDIELRFKNIKTIHGYHTTLKKIRRAKLTAWQNQDFPALNYWMESVESGRDQRDYNKENRQFPLFIAMFGTERDRPFMDVGNELAMDIAIALHREPTAPRVSDAQNYELNETVSDLVLNGWDYLIGEGQKPYFGVLVNVDVHFSCDPWEMVTYGTE